MLRKWQSAAQLQLLKSKYPDSHIAVHLGLDGAHATAVLWQSAAELLTMSEVSLSSSSCVIALEDDRLAQNFCHILEWGLTHVPDLREFRTVLHVEYLADDKAVRLVHQASRDVMRDWSIRNPSLDSARINQHTQAWVKRVLVKMGICKYLQLLNKLYKCPMKSTWSHSTSKDRSVYEIDPDERTRLSGRGSTRR